MLPLQHPFDGGFEVFGGLFGTGNSGIQDTDDGFFLRETVVFFGTAEVTGTFEFGGKTEEIRVVRGYFQIDSLSRRRL